MSEATEMESLLRCLRESTLASGVGVQAAQEIHRLLVQDPGSNSGFVMDALANSRSIQFSWALYRILAMLPTKVLESDTRIRTKFDTLMVGSDLASREVRVKIISCFEVVGQCFDDQLFAGFNKLHFLLELPRQGTNL